VTDTSPNSAPLPTGVVTFMFTDIEGSTKLVHELGNQYPEVLNLHHRLLRAAGGKSVSVVLVVQSLTRGDYVLSLALFELRLRGFRTA
jgi:hypothetical protein